MERGNRKISAQRLNNILPLKPMNINVCQSVLNLLPCQNDSSQSLTCQSLSELKRISIQVLWNQVGILHSLIHLNIDMSILKWVKKNFYPGLRVSNNGSLFWYVDIRGFLGYMYVLCYSLCFDDYMCSSIFWWFKEQ